jgi:hypothetical protein
VIIIDIDNPLSPPVKYNNERGLFNTNIGSNNNRLPFHAIKRMKRPLEYKSNNFLLISSIPLP